MTTQFSSVTSTKDLYDRDYYLWLQQTAQLIKETSVRVKTVLSIILRSNRAFSQRKNQGFSLSRTQVIIENSGYQ